MSAQRGLALADDVCAPPALSACGRLGLDRWSSSAYNTSGNGSTSSQRCAGRPIARSRMVGSSPEGWLLSPFHRIATPRSRCGNSVITPRRSEEHTSDLQSLMCITYAAFCLKKKMSNIQNHTHALHTTQHI